MTDDQPESITFECSIGKVQTLADGGIRVWLDLPEGALLAAVQLMQCQVIGVYLDATLTPQK